MPSIQLHISEDHPMSSNPAPYQYELPAIGDVILCRGAGKASRWNVAGQRMLRWVGPVHYSHVALQLHGFVLHAMPKGGVHAMSTLHLLTRGEQRSWCVYRHKIRDIPDQQANIKSGVNQIVTRAQYFLGQRYNRKFLWPKLHALTGRVDEDAFCSELICHVFEGTPARDTIRRRRATSVLPADIERAIAGSSDWIDVTEIYKRHVSDCSVAGMLGRWIESEQSNADLFEKLARVQAKLAEAEVDSHHNLRALHAVEHRLRRGLGLRPKQQQGRNAALFRRLETINWRVAKAGAAGRRQMQSLMRKLR